MVTRKAKLSWSYPTPQRTSTSKPFKLIFYKNKEWFGIFRLHKADTFRKLFPLIILLSAYTVLIVLVETYWFHPTSEFEAHIKNVPLMHGLLGFAISMLLVFRTNTAYDRWWEGRRLWGSLVNVSRNLSIKFKVLVGKEDPIGRQYFATLIPRFAVALMNHLRNEASAYALDDAPHPEIPDFDTGKHLPAQIAGLIYERANELYINGRISGEQLLTVNTEITELLNICGACERIRNTPIPYSYSAFIKKFIFAYVITLPLGFVFSLGFMAVPVVAFVFYVLASLELIAEDIEGPFGKDSNDLPLERLCEIINSGVKEIFSENNPVVSTELKS